MTKEKIDQGGAVDAVDTCWALLFVAWLIALGSMLGALFLGEVMGHAPCTLCWYQRICMFPLAAILAVGLFPLDRSVLRYAAPLALAGLLVAAYHWLLTVGVIPETLAPCVQGIPCSKVQVTWLGFLTIPLLSFMAFLAINLLLAVTYFKFNRTQGDAPFALR